MPPGVPATAAIRALRAAGVSFEPYPYTYEHQGGTAHAAATLRVDEHAVVKTLVMEATDGTRRRPAPLLVLMHGDREVSTRALARSLGVKTVAPASPQAVERVTGYQPGGVSPFGTRQALPVYVERSVLALEAVFVNGGRRGLLVAMAPQAFVDVLKAEPVDVAVG